MSQIHITCDTKLHLPLEDLTPIQGNLKELTVENFEKLKRSIIENGFNFPLLVYLEAKEVESRIEGGRRTITMTPWLLDGHGRRLVLNKLREDGYTIPLLPCVAVEATNLNEAKKKVLLISSQFHTMTKDGLYEFLSTSEIDPEFLDSIEFAQGINVEEFRDEFFQDPPAAGDGDEDAVPEPPKVAKSKRGELWILGEHRVLCGDSTSKEDVERLMAGEKADMVFTDPPYGIGIVKLDGNVGGERIGGNGPSKKYSILGCNKYRPIHGDDAPFNPVFLLELAPIQLIWGANCFASKLPDNPAWIIWDKKPDGNFDNDFSDAELAWTNLERRTVKTYRHLWAGMTRAGNRKEEMSGRVHPTQKPVGLCAAIIQDISNQDTLIVDPFLGSGSTLIACEKTQRRCYGMEIEPLYIDVILDRWSKYSGKTAKREDGTPWEYVRDSGD